ncbi:MAG: hypothetical protein K0R98_1771 [Rickettsiaceae bacterium]|nr:hypothetical protein [Rickettsiaceae bacterium]
MSLGKCFSNQFKGEKVLESVAIESVSPRKRVDRLAVAGTIQINGRFY